VPLSEFRVAAPATVSRNLAKTAVQIVVMWSTALYLGPVLLATVQARLRLEFLDFVPLRRTGFALLVLFSLCGLWSGGVLVVHGHGTPLPLDTARTLVIAGPYRHIRNPMALTGVGQALSVGMMLGSFAVLTYALVGGLLWNYVLRPREEANLERRFGEAYSEYRRDVPCWRVRRHPYRPVRRG